MKQGQRKRERERLNIAMLGHKRIPSREGGIEIVVEELCVRMAALGHSVTCYNRKGHHVSGARFDQTAVRQYEGVNIRTVPTIEKRGGLRYLPPSLRLSLLLSDHMMWFIFTQKDRRFFAGFLSCAGNGWW